MLEDIRTPEDFLAALGIDGADALLAAIRLNPVENLYREKGIWTGPGRMRKLQIPRKKLKLAQFKIARLLNPIYVPPPHVHGYVAGRGHVTNAKLHVRKRFVTNFDIQNFFPSIRQCFVVNALSAPPFNLPPHIANWVWSWCSFDGGLPMGAPSSPLLSNIACTQLDRRLADIGQSFDGVMSRYCDDMTFSSNEPLPNHIMVFDGTVPGKIDPGPGLAGSLEESGFEVNSKKTRLRTSAQCQQVTGVTVNKFPNVPRSKIRELRAILRAWKKYGRRRAAAHYFRKRGLRIRGGRQFKSCICGQISYVGQIRGRSDHLFAALWKQYEALLRPQRLI